MRRRFGFLCGLLIQALVTATALGADAPAQRNPPSSGAQSVLDQAAREGKFTFLVFFRDKSQATQAMARVVETGVAKRTTNSAAAYVHITDPGERAIVERFDVARTAMPLTLAIAPNGAITGVFSKAMLDEHLESAIVTPTMMNCMKSLQENKLVFVCLQASETLVVPVGVQAMQSSPQFKDRVVVFSMQLRDPAESRFLEQLQIDPVALTAPTAVLLAPPGVKVGSYDGSATMDQIAAELHNAGKCCDDANCKHNHGAHKQASQPSKSRRN